MLKPTEHEVFDEHLEWAMALVNGTIRKKRWNKRLSAELMAAGLRGLFEASRKWDRKRNFRCFASQRIVGSCMDWLRYEDYKKKPRYCKQKKGIELHLKSESWDPTVMDERFSTFQRAVIKQHPYTPEEIVAQVEGCCWSRQVKDAILDMLVYDRGQYVFGLMVRYKGKIFPFYNLMTKGIIDCNTEIAFVRRDYHARNTSVRRRRPHKNMETGRGDSATAGDGGGGNQTTREKKQRKNPIEPADPALP